MYFTTTCHHLIGSAFTFLLVPINDISYNWCHLDMTPRIAPCSAWSLCSRWVMWLHRLDFLLQWGTPPSPVGSEIQKAGVCLRAIFDAYRAKHFQDRSARVSCRRNRAILAVLWDVCRQHDLWACQLTLYGAQVLHGNKGEASGCTWIPSLH